MECRLKKGQDIRLEVRGTMEEIEGIAEACRRASTEHYWTSAQREALGRVAMLFPPIEAGWGDEDDGEID